MALILATCFHPLPLRLGWHSFWPLVLPLWVPVRQLFLSPGCCSFGSFLYFGFRSLVSPTCMSCPFSLTGLDNCFHCPLSECDAELARRESTTKREACTAQCSIFVCVGERALPGAACFAVTSVHHRYLPSIRLSEYRGHGSLFPEYVNLIHS